jgi:mRNA interferase MazF
MTKYEVVLVPFPFDDLSSNKVRPAVCLTDPIGDHDHIILAFITSRVSPNPLPSDIILVENNPGFYRTGLRVSSMIQLHRLMTVSASLIQRQLGELSPELVSIVRRRLKNLFGLGK